MILRMPSFEAICTSGCLRNFDNKPWRRTFVTLHTCICDALHSLLLTNSTISDYSILKFIQKVWSWREHCGFYWSCSSSPQRWQLSGWTGTRYCEEDEGVSFSLPKIKAILGLIILKLLFSVFVFWRSSFSKIAFFGVFCSFWWRILIYLPFVWPWRTSPGLAFFSITCCIV